MRACSDPSILKPESVRECEWSNDLAERNNFMRGELLGSVPDASVEIQP